MLRRGGLVDVYAVADPAVGATRATGGTVTAGPRPGGGASVGFELPLVDVADDEPTPFDGPPPAAAPAPGAGITPPTPA